MANQPGVSVGPAMSEDEEAAHKKKIAKQLADEAETALDSVKELAKQLQASIKDREAELKRLRAEAKE